MIRECVLAPLRKPRSNESHDRADLESSLLVDEKSRQTWEKMSTDERAVLLDWLQRAWRLRERERRVREARTVLAWGRSPSGFARDLTYRRR